MGEIQLKHFYKQFWTCCSFSSLAYRCSNLLVRLWPVRPTSHVDQDDEVILLAEDDDALVPMSKPMMDFEAWKMKLLEATT